LRLTGHLNLGLKFALMFTALALMGLTEFGALVERLVSYRAEARVSQMVGHQHMLVYRIAAQAAEIALPGSAEPLAINDLRSSTDDFDQALAALLDGNPSRDLPALSNAEERLAAERVRAKWMPFRAAVEALIAHEGDPEVSAQTEAIGFIFKNQGELMGAVYDLVNLLRVHADQKANSVWQFGLLMGGVYVMVILMGWVAVEQGISLPLRRLASAAESMARGDVRAGTGLPIHTRDEIGRLTRAFNHMAENLDQAFSAMRESNRGLATLNAVSGAVRESLDVDEMLMAALTAALEALGLEYGAIMLLDPDDGLVLRAQRGLASDSTGGNAHLLLGEEVSARVALTGEPMLIEDIAREPGIGLNIVQLPGWRCFASVPIKSKGRIVGVINVAGSRSQMISQADLELLAAAGASIGVAVEHALAHEAVVQRAGELQALANENARLFEELQKQLAANAQAYAELERRARQLQTLHAVSRMLVGTLDLEAVLQTLAGSACKLIGARHCTLAAFDEDGTLTHFVSDNLVADGAPGGVQQFVRRELPSVLLGEGHTLRLDKLLAAPITVRGKAFGNIYVTEKENGQPFTAEDEEQLKALAAEAALALENARLFEQVVRSQKEWETTFDAIAEGVALYDSQFTILRANRALGRLLGTTPQALAGQNVHQALCGCQTTECEILTAQRSDQVESIEFPDAGHRRRFQMFHCPVEGSDGHPVSAVLILRDVTQERIWQMRMLQTEKMASLGQLAAGVAHEINNPLGYINSNLNSLAGYATELRQVLTAYRSALTELAEQQWGRGTEVLSGVNAQGQRSRGDMIPSAHLLSREFEHKLDFLLQDFAQAVVESQEGVERVQNIVSSLKNFARVDESYEMKYVDLHEGLESMLKIVWNELKYKATVERDYGHLPPVRCHLPRLSQVFLNLLVNAAQAIETNGKITIRTWAEGDRAIVAITDNGCGIPAANIPRLFEPFFTTKEIGQNTGLGLSVAYGIVQEHNGRIEVESTVGQGSTFTVVLPVHGP